LKILRVMNQHILFGWHSNSFLGDSWYEPETVPIEFRYKIGEVMFSCFRDGVCTVFPGDWSKMSIFSSSPTFEETKFRGPNGSFDGIFRILASPRFWRALSGLHA